MTPLERLLIHLECGQTELATRLDCTRQHVFNALHGRVRMGPDLLERLFDLPGIEDAMGELGLTHRDFARGYTRRKRKPKPKPRSEAPRAEA